MKKTLLLSAALFAATQLYAVDLYVVGANVNGAEAWGAGSKMTDKGNGTYEWTGTELGSGFKINNGGWDTPEYNFGAPEGQTEVTLDTPKSYATGDGSADFTFNGFKVTNPKVVLNMNAQTITVTGTQATVEPPTPGEVTFYIIGSDVNGQSWALAASDAAFTDKGNGIYVWTGEKLGTGFKVNDGTWSNAAYNFGSAGGEISMNVPFYYWADGGSGNIAFAGGYTMLLNPEVTLDLNAETITLTGGQFEGQVTWYIAGINGVYELTEDWELSQVAGSNVYQREVYVVEEQGKCKVSDTGWAHQYGTNLPDDNFISPTNLTVMLEPVNGEGGDVPYELQEGTYLVKFDLDELELTFASPQDGVEVVVMGEGNAVYYNLHGQKVNNPEKGIFVKVANGKAVKVVK